MKKLLFMVVALLCPSLGLAQGVRYQNFVIDKNGRAISGAAVRVCTEPASGTPCSPLSSVFSDKALTVPLANPLTTDTAGNYFFYVAPNTYHVQISGTGFTTFDYPDIEIGTSTAGSLAGLRVGYQAVTFSSTPTFDTSIASVFKMTLTGNVTSSTISNALAGQEVVLYLCQDGTGSRTFAYPGTVIRGPVVSPAASTCTSVEMFYDGSNWRHLAATGDALALPKNSGVSGDQQFVVDNAYDIGNLGAVRPRDVHIAGEIWKSSTSNFVNTNPSYQVFTEADPVLSWNAGTNIPFINLINSNDVDQQNMGGIGWTRSGGQSDGHAQIAAIFARQKTTGILAGSELYFATKVGGGSGLGSPALGDWKVSDLGHFQAVTDNLVDIGAAGATRPRTGYFATSLVSPSLVLNGTTLNAVSGSGSTLMLNNAPTVTGTGISAPAFIDTAANVASTGFVRAANASSVVWRNFANSGDVTLAQGGAASGAFPADTLVYSTAISSSIFVTGTTASTTGAIRLKTGDALLFRDNAGASDINGLSKDTSDRVTVGGAAGVFLRPLISTRANPASVGDIRFAAQDQLNWRDYANTINLGMALLPAAANLPDNTMSANFPAFYTPALVTSTAGSTVGAVRLATTDLITFRNNANSANIVGLAKGVTDVVSVGDAAGIIINSLGTPLKKVLSATASLDFTALAANSCEVLTVTVTGAADGDTVSLGVPNALIDVDGATERTVFVGWVSAAGTVSVRRCNVTAGATADPAAATVRATVTQF